MSIPNLKHEVEAAVARWPAAFHAAHRGGPDTEDFIRLLASYLHYEVDPRIGLNGKRGNPHDLSDDCLCYDGIDEARPSGDHDPTRNGARVTVIDVIGAAPSRPGQPDGNPAWNHPLTAAAAAWVRPERIHANGHPTPAPPPPPEVPVPPPHTCPVCDHADVLAAIATLRDDLAVATLNADAARVAAHHAVAAAESALRIENQLARGFDLSFNARFLGTVRAHISPTES